MDQLRDPRVLLTLVGLALAANLLYCAAHLVDFGLQLTRLRAPWLKVRWLLLLAGCWLALFIEHQQTGLISGLFRMI